MKMIERCEPLRSAFLFVRRRSTMRNSKKEFSEYRGNEGGFEGATFVITLASETGVAGAGVKILDLMINPSGR